MLAQLLGLGTAAASIPGAGNALNNAVGSSPTYGGGNALSGDANGGSSANPLPGLSADDYGTGFKRGGLVPRGYADGGVPGGESSFNFSGVPGSSGGIGFIPQSQVRAAQAPHLQAPSMQPNQSNNLGSMVGQATQLAGSLRGFMSPSSGSSLFGGSSAAAPAAAGTDVAAGTDAAADAGAAATADAGATAGATSVADLLPFLALAKRGGRIQGMDSGGVPADVDQSDLAQAAAAYGPIPSSSLDDIPSAPSLAQLADNSQAQPPVPRGIRNNNPLNIENGQFTASQPGYAGPESQGRFATFDTPQAGMAAASNLLDSYGNKGINTVNGIVSRWAPSSDGNNTQAYSGFVSKQLGVDPNQPLDMTNPQVRTSVASAMSRFENGRALGFSGDADADAYASDPALAAINTAASGSAPPAPVQPQRVAQAQPTGNGSVADTLWQGLGNQPLSNEANQALMAAGFGMMASRSPFPGVAIGEGGLQGVNTYQKAQELSRMADQTRAQIANEQSEMALRNGPQTDYMRAQTEDVKSQAAQRAIQNQLTIEQLKAMRSAAQNPILNPQAAAPSIGPGPASASPESDAAFNRPPVPLTMPDGTVVPPAQAAETGAANQAPIARAQALASQITGVAKTPQGDLVAVNSRGQPLENLATIQAQANAWRQYGPAWPAAQKTADDLQTHADNMIKAGVQISSDGSVMQIPNLAKSQADTAGLKAGAEAKARYPYEAAAALLRNAGRPFGVSPNESVTTSEQISPEINAITRQLLGQLGTPGQESTPPASVAGNGQPQPPGNPAQPSPSGTSLGVPSGAPGTSAFTPHLVRNPDGSLGSSVTPGLEQIQKDTAADYVKSRDAYTGGQESKVLLASMENDLAQLNKNNWSSTGPGAQAKLQFAADWNSLMRTAGLQGAQFDPNTVGNWEELGKDSTRLGFALARTMGSREAAQIVQGAIGANPGIMNSPTGGKMVLNTVRQAINRQSDLYEYETNFAKQNGGDLLGADVAFNKQNPPGLYAKRAELQTKLDIPEDAVDLLKSNPTPEAIAKFDKWYGDKKGANDPILKNPSRTLITIPLTPANVAPSSGGQ